ncbi:flagellar basal-body rod protein flgc, putative [Heliomicrobium modesticaldum Ice1]|uniref:Flagellar basal-body rod protein FlgC n=1 Tax=Heliobacterium modesticaldum (strain ATCC 51547 / Ice1) TaxID=498761 RepID=B0THA0_HELMI|nr:flagellar basal body rod protein FlgC [Heliomicrobium modesticaldum]ABZ84775.1 flagellar basal-body rod protein flgc, putative [Heliomicrobium modesticaldum Ice1]
MRFLSSIDTSASGLTAQRFRMDIISNNLANVNTTRTGNSDADGVLPYRRQIPVFAARQAEADTFASALSAAENRRNATGGGVRVVAVAEDESAFKMIYDPQHPDAIRTGPLTGYVRMPNVNTVTEMVDMISATRAYEANVTAINAAKSMAMKALEIGKG